MSMKALRQTIKKSAKRQDTFPMGTVIRWKTDAGYNVFLYAAVKTPVGWSTTARTGNRFVSQLLSFEDLLEVLGRSETIEIAVAAEWEFLLENGLSDDDEPEDYPCASRCRPSEGDVCGGPRCA